jgi:hypothetical protein
MSRAFDIVVVGVITIISAVIHRVGVELFAPDQPLYSIATDGTEVMNGAARADLWFQIISIWTPLLAFGGIMAWAVIREYRRSVTTATQARP